MQFLSLACKHTLLFFCLFTSQNLSALQSVDVSFSVIVTGNSAGTQEAMVVEKGEWFTQRKLTHNAIIIKHPKGDLLWDTGIGKEVSAQLSILNFWQKELFLLENVNPAVEQLTAENYPVININAIIPSHMHWDHVSALNDFVSTPIWIQKKELDAAHHAKPPSFILSQFDNPKLNWQFITLRDIEYRGFPKSLDIYNDGSLVLVDLSGHTQGHLGLFINTLNKGRYFLIGDTSWIMKGIVNNDSRPGFVEWFVNIDDDVEKNKRQITKIHQLTKQFPEMVIVPAHDEEVTATLPQFPDFL